MEFVKPHTPLHGDQYYQEKMAKKYIFLHHTAGRDAEGAISWWNAKPDHVGTPFIIERNGNIIQTFDPSFWAYSLGVKGFTDVEKASIHIEMVAWGPLTMKNNAFYSYTGELVPNNEVTSFKSFYRECYFYQCYTKAQLDSLSMLLKYLIPLYHIKVQPDLTNFWFYDGKWGNDKPAGIWSHSTVRKDKSDIMPQKELISLMYQTKWV